MYIMKPISYLSWMTFICITASTAQSLKEYKPTEKKTTPRQAEEILTDRKKSSHQLALIQDELSADVQEIVEDQTNEKVILLFEEVEGLMANVTDNLDIAKTGEETLFKENLIIEKIFEAAKEKSK